MKLRRIKTITIKPKVSATLKSVSEKKQTTAQEANVAPKSAPVRTKVAPANMTITEVPNGSRKPIVKPALSRLLVRTLENGATPVHVNVSAGNPSPALRSVPKFFYTEALLERFSEDKAMPKFNNPASTR
jgi:hypothetical protein